MIVLDRKRLRNQRAKVLRIIKERDLQRYKLGGQLSEGVIQVWPLGPGPEDRRELGRASTGETEVQTGKAAGKDWESRDVSSTVTQRSWKGGAGNGEKLLGRLMNAKASMWGPLQGTGTHSSPLLGP